MMYLFITQLLYLAFISNAQINQTNQSNFTTTIWPQTTIITEYFTTEPRDVICSSDYAFVSIKSSSLTISETVLSERTNYPPYGYTTSIVDAKVVEYANGETISQSINNPCDISTWSTPSSYYNHTVVLIQYDHFYDILCTPQQWSLNLQNYGNIQALLIANDDALTSVYTLSGDTKLSNPHIPTRMISKDTATQIVSIMSDATEDIYASIECFNDTSHPNVICILDSSTVAVIENILLDGEYQQQASILTNDHPVWFKESSFNNDYYIWLTVNHSRDDTPWRWVIGTDYTDDNSIDIECVLNDTDTYIDDPTLCGNNWYRNGSRQYNMSSHGGICNAGDIFVCVDSGMTWFQTHFAGRYRQLHKNIAYYVSETAPNATVLSIQQDYYYYYWTFNAGFGDIAYCQITSQETFGSPWKCALWTVFDFDAYQYVDTNQFDVDECSHPNISLNHTIYYPESLCLTDPLNDKSSFYQGYHGIYILDDTQPYDGRYVYKNQRLNGSLYFLYVDQYDIWVINEQVPVAIPTTVQGYCDADVDTPDLCTDCWYFLEFVIEMQCDINLFDMNSTVESDCIELPINNIVDYAQEMPVCFDDNTNDIYTHLFTGTYVLEDNLFNDRAVWSQTDADNSTWFVYYSARWRYWVIDDTIREINAMPSWTMMCLLWEEYEPWNCSEWYSIVGGGIAVTSMRRDCTFPPTLNPTVQPTFATLHPTTHPTSQPTTSPTVLIMSSMFSTQLGEHGTQSRKGNRNSGIVVVVVVVCILLLLTVVIFIYLKKLKKRNEYQGHTVVDEIEIIESQHKIETQLLDEVDGHIDETQITQ